MFVRALLLRLVKAFFTGGITTALLRSYGVTDRLAYSLGAVLFGATVVYSVRDAEPQKVVISTDSPKEAATQYKNLLDQMKAGAPPVIHTNRGYMRTYGSGVRPSAAIW